MADPRFRDGKDADALRTIGEVSDALGIKPHVLRYWEQQFPMLKPVKRSGGRRYYRPEDVELIDRIDQLVNREGYTLKGAKQALKSGSAAVAGGVAAAPAMAAVAPAPEPAPEPVVAAVAQPPAPPSDVLARLRSIRGKLSRALH